MKKNTLMNKLTSTLTAGMFSVATIFAPLNIHAETEYCLDFPYSGYNAKAQTFVTAQLNTSGAYNTVRINILGVDLNNNTNTVWVAEIHGVVWNSNADIILASTTVTNSSVGLTCDWVNKCTSRFKTLYGTVRKNGGSYTYGEWNWKG